MAETVVDLSSHFSDEQLNSMSNYEKTRTQNLIRNYNYMRSIGLQPTKPAFMIPPIIQKSQTAVVSTSVSNPSLQETPYRRTVRKVKVKKTKNVTDVKSVTPKKRPARERKQVKRFQPPPVKLQVEKHLLAQIESNRPSVNTTPADDSFEEFANNIQFDGTMLGTRVLDTDYDPRDFDWSSDAAESDQENFSEEEIKPKAKRGVKKARKQRSPYRPLNNIKMIIDSTKKKILPRRKCAASVYSYKEDDVDNDDSFIYCEDCQLEYVDRCEAHPLIPMFDTQVPLGVEDRARKTLPTGLSLSLSKIKNAGRGVWTDVNIKKFTRFGPYEGVKQTVSNVKEDNVSGYGWLVTDKSSPHYIDGEDIKQSNWLRYVNCARTKQEQNCEAFQYRGKIYYKSLRDIGIGHELLVWYGDDYALDLGINKDQYTASIMPAKKPEEHLAPEGTVFYDCTLCKAKFVNKAACRRHIFWHSRKQEDQALLPTVEPACLIKCDKCDFRCVHQKELTKHSKYHDDKKWRFVCEQCDARLDTNRNLQQHMRTHTGEKPYKCDQCDARFTLLQNLQGHTRTHTGEKPFKCDLCAYRTAHKSDLSKHRRTHTGEKPYKCDQCDARFTLPHHLQQHVRTHTGDRPYKCDQCDARFTQLAHLQQHMKTHTGEKPYKCDQCGARFTLLQNLQGHTRTHTGEKPFKCDLCAYRTAHKSDLSKHRRTHTGEKPYKCNQCTYRSTHSKLLKSHMRSHMKEDYS